MPTLRRRFFGAERPNVESRRANDYLSGRTTRLSFSTAPTIFRTAEGGPHADGLALSLVCQETQIKLWALPISLVAVGPRCARSAPLLSSGGTRSATTVHWQIGKLPKTCRYSIALAPSAKCEAPMLAGGSSAAQGFIVLPASTERLFVQGGSKIPRSPHAGPATI